MRTLDSTRRFATIAVLPTVVAAAALLAGCGKSSSPVASKPVSSDSSALASVSTAQAPSPVVVPPPTPVIPDAMETKAAWREGVALFDGGNYPGAVERLRVAALGRPNDAYTHYLLGLSLLKSGELELAEESLVRSSELNGDSDRTWINLARVRMERGDAEGALHAAETALALSPSSAKALHQRGRAEAALGRLDDAIETLKSASAAEPGDGYIANTLGYLLIQRGRPEEAISPLESARQQLPGVAFVRNNLGVAYERSGKIEEAVAEYRAATEAGDSDGKAAQSLARLTPLLETSGIAKKHEPEPTGEAVASTTTPPPPPAEEPNPGPR